MWGGIVCLCRVGLRRKQSFLIWAFLANDPFEMTTMISKSESFSALGDDGLVFVQIYSWINMSVILSCEI